MQQRIIKDHRELFQSDYDIAACIGYFDGVHLGHQKLINKTIAVAKEKGLKSALITFDPDPWTVIHNKNKVNHITPIKEKMRLIASLGIDELIIVQFNKEVSKLEPQVFIEQILIPLRVSDLIVGEDFKFGFKGAGNVAYLQEHAAIFFHTHVLTFKEQDDKKIGTTLISQAILKGDFDRANEMLGRAYTLSGYVKQGNREGTRIGFPTANLDVVDEYVLPPKGVYAGYVEVKGEKHKSVLNIGHNPTFNHSKELSIETHILDYNDIIYGELLKQSFVYRIRDEIEFPSVEALIKQMEEDVKIALEVLK
ncbi:riboflavin biosynthesis protein RibF [Erysipelothrix urinaevulpis]|uniref:riboflavin biosynthesis protein RibF n=1 Tax=Erysipelothrix urinaevulpis TaxID=2683717 RepID=UPI00135CE010|nr:riboflavin biosynthesis protein RibF [Erysipelothrix urinaevulpis]